MYYRTVPARLHLYWYSTVGLPVHVWMYDIVLYRNVIILKPTTSEPINVVSEPIRTIAKPNSYRYRRWVFRLKLWKKERIEINWTRGSRDRDPIHWSKNVNIYIIEPTFSCIATSIFDWILHIWSAIHIFIIIKVKYHYYYSLYRIYVIFALYRF